jgi:hypothetical protein
MAMKLAIKIIADMIMLITVFMVVFEECLRLN